MDTDYIARINQAINYIYKNLDKNLTVEDIADHCCFSKYYFNRIFKSIVNESIYTFIKRLKLESSAFKLRTTRRSITDIAIEAGYSPSNFASAFKEYFGISASEFRRENIIPLKDTYKTVIDYIQSMKKQEDFFSSIDSKITIKEIGPLTLEYRRYIGNYYLDLLKEWENFCSEIESKYDLNKDIQFIGISYDDPIIAVENHCIYDLCVKVDKVNSINVHRIPAKTYACYEVYDRRENLMKRFNDLLALWLPFSPYDIAEGLCLEWYRTGLDEHGKIHLEICVPIKK